MSVHTSERDQPTPAPPPPEIPFFTRAAALALWGGLTLFAVLLTPGYTSGNAASALEARRVVERYGYDAISAGGSSTLVEMSLLWIPILVAGSAVTLAGTWYYLYRVLKFYLLPVLFLGARPPDRGNDVRTMLGLQSFRRAFVLLALTALVRMLPNILVQVSPVLARALGGLNL